MMSIPFRALLYRRTSEPSAITVTCGGEIHPVRVRRHRQARRYTLRILAASREVVLTMPTRGSLKHAKEFAQKHSAWITSRLRRLPGAAPFAHGEFLPLRGRECRIDHRPGARGTVWIETHGSGHLLCVAGEKPHLSRRVHDYLKREAKRDLQAASQSAAQALGIAFKRVSVRDQSSRWGSCSSSGVLSYSWRLVMAPPFVLEYLAAHEVAHLIEMNHSRRFWRLVESICPQMGRAKAWLDAHGADLHRYGLDSR
ncbi:MAG TPA: SprT family zinc-dependent metalloprotease [Pseudolabrys sp.]